MAGKVVNPRVFFDVAIGKTAPARVVMELFADTTPKVVGAAVARVSWT